MTPRLIRFTTSAALAWALLAAVHPSTVRAEVPPGYTGTPFGGTAWSVPGRIDFEDFDEGGMGVGWDVDDHTGNFGEGGCAGNGHRNDATHPQLCQTNTDEGDVYSEGPLLGMTYPTDGSPSIYLGYAHADDWVQLTVDVKQAGTYALSSTWASDAAEALIGFEVSFNDVVKATVSLPGTGGYHNWVQFDDFARVDLEAGVQVLKFRLTTFHLNYDYLQLSLVLPGGGIDDGTGGAAAGGAGGAAAGGAGGEGAGGVGGAPAGGTGGVIAAAGSAALAGAGGEASSTGGTPEVVMGSGGTAGAVTGAGGTTTTVTDPAPVDSAAAGNTGAVNTESGCSIRGVRKSAPTGFMLAFGIGLLAFSRRRRS